MRKIGSLPIASRGMDCTFYAPKRRLDGGEGCTVQMDSQVLLISQGVYYDLGGKKEDANIPEELKFADAEVLKHNTNR
jgi:hypothetical protein